jgi:uncharacterized membrane protein
MTMPRELQGAASSSHRIKAIDWLRGLSVVFMIECHSLYFLLPSLEKTQAWYRLQAINGLVSVAFLFAAGFSSGLVVSRAAGDAITRRRRSKRTLLRIAEVLALSIYIHFAWYPVLTQPWTLLRVEILMCICIGLLMVWAIVTMCRGRHGLPAGALLALWGTITAASLWTGAYRGGYAISSLFNTSTGSMFPIFPWVGYLLLGGIVGIFAAHPHSGRRWMTCGLAALTAVAMLLALTPLGDALWRWCGTMRLFGDAKPDVYLVSNSFERIWKLGATCLVLLGAEWVAGKAGAAAWTRVLRPIGVVMEYFSKMALPAYFAHLALLYGFCGIQFTQVWHRKSNWVQYGWRLGALWCLTALVCYGLHRARRGIEWMIRNLRGTPKTAAATA